jgi:hypothetical protein
MIKPTVGRIVWYHWSPEAKDNVPIAAIITGVVDDATVHLCLFQPTRAPMPVAEVRLIQEGEKPPLNVPHCEWMPYQKAVAAGKQEPTKHAT